MEYRDKKQPIHNKEAEMSILGSIFINQDSLLEVQSTLKPNMFYFPQHIVVYEAMLKLFNQNKPIDLVSVDEELRKNENIDKIGGVFYLTELTRVVPTHRNIAEYRSIVVEAFLRRIGTEILVNAEKCLESRENDVMETVNKCCDSLARMVEVQKDYQTVGIKEVMVDVMDHVEKVYECQGSEEVVGLKTGYQNLDNNLVGLAPQELIIIAGRPSAGKTAIALDMARNMLKTGKSVLFCSLEMSKRAIGTRLLSREAKINSIRLKDGSLDAHDWKKVANANSVIDGYKLKIYDKPSCTVGEIKAEIMKAKREHGIQIVFIDYLLLIKNYGRQENERLRVGGNIKFLRSVARELDIPIVLLTQLGRSAEDREPRKSDLKETGAAEEDSDVILLLYEDEAGLYQVIIAKNRNGPIDKICMQWEKNYGKFKPMQRKALDSTKIKEYEKKPTKTKWEHGSSVYSA